MAVAAFSQSLPYLRSWLFRWVSGSWFRRQLGPPAPRPAFEDMAVVQEAVEHGGDGRAVAEGASPVLNRAVSSYPRARAFVTGHDNRPQTFFSCGSSSTE